MDRRMLVIAGIATAALALPGCGDSTDNAAQAAPVTDEVDATVGTEGVGSDHSDRDKTLYFRRSDASQR